MATRRTGMPPIRSVAPQPPAAWPVMRRSPHVDADTVGGVGSLGEAPQLPALLRLPSALRGVTPVEVLARIFISSATVLPSSCVVR